MNAIQTITQAVAKDFGIEVHDVQRRGNSSVIVLPRQIATYLSRELANLSLSIIARAWGQHHTTVLYSIDHIKHLRTIDPALDRRVGRLQEYLSIQLKSNDAPPSSAPPAHINDLYLNKRIQRLQREFAKSVHLAATVSRQCIALGEEIAAVRQGLQENEVEQPASPDELRSRHAKLATRFPYDATDPPMAGTRCVWCAELGHWCPAKGLCGEQPVCPACGRGELCVQAQAVAILQSGLDAMSCIDLAGFSANVTRRTA